MKDIQDHIKKFNDLREWSKSGSIKDLLLNINEEIGEFWNIIKWVDTETQQRLISENRGEVENFIGDMVYLILKIAYLCDIDSEQAIKKVLKEYERRFPEEQTRGKHGNEKAGGIDFK